MQTVAEIAAEAFDGVEAELSDAIQAASLVRAVNGAYDTAAGAHVAGTPISQTGRAVVDSTRPVADVFPDYVVGPGDELILLEGFTSCVENDALTFAGRTRTVRKVQDIVASGTLFFVMAR